jgi:hypothetical protein
VKKCKPLVAKPIVLELPGISPPYPPYFPPESVAFVRTLKENLL